MKFKTPPVTKNQKGEERSVGFEFEFTGVEMADAAKMVVDLYGGETEQVSGYEFKVKDSDYGTFSLELDASLFLNKKYEGVLKSVGLDVEKLQNKDKLEDTLREMASTVVPFEIITPPIPFSQLDALNKLVDKLREWKAKGTGSSFFYAFGLHLNPEVPELTAESLLRHLKAYVMLDAWIRQDADIDISRKLTPYINEYEMKYIRHILQEDYLPDLETLIRDYFEFDNSRNRPLDMLPVFRFLEEELTEELLDEKLTSARPTFHYRLPNCSIQDESWSLGEEWNRWWLVERLAADEQTLNQYSRRFLQMDEKTLFSVKRKWIKLMDRWVQNVR
ncbi:MAG: amidoligase family protein [Gracilimonas sp.]|uniref:amidoligase family protein n=1 Tax=Gracilimonas TaxID=649462 RepID=UPI001B090AC7|nr:amidoligase family protein [Gracilimonas sp.]MBO6584690.1 amidoligase family protein [Gracilimonas sp.]MBO6616039.1 amidoligase family protein [Gracilimonas sp.]